MMTADRYALTEDYEKAVAYYCASSPNFFGRIGHAVDPARVEHSSAKLTIEACRAIWQERGRGPDSPCSVVQRIRRWVEDGRVRFDDLLLVNDLFDTVEEDDKRPEEDAVLMELVPILRRVMQQEAAISATEDYAKGSDFGRTISIVERSRRLGEVDESIGIRLGSGSVEAMAEIRKLDKLPLGIIELDLKLRGGLRRGCFGLLLGGTGDGKSIGLGHIAATGMRNGLFVAYATLEVIPADVFARIEANLTGIPIDLILENEVEAIRAEKQIAAMSSGGIFRVHEFTPLVTTFPDIAAWIDKIEREEGREVDLLCTDYGDKIGAPKAKGKTEDGGYRTGLVVFEAMRNWANQKRRWHWSASQATRRKDRKKLLEVDDTADSMHKVRVADLVISLNLDGDRQMTFRSAKARHGGAGLNVGPLPTDFELGRICPIVEAGPDPTVAQVIRADEAAVVFRPKAPDA